MPDLSAAADTVIEKCLAVAPGEDVLVVVDAPTRAIGEVLRERASAAGADAVLAVMDPRATDGTEPPRAIAQAFVCPAPEAFHFDGNGAAGLTKLVRSGKSLPGFICRLQLVLIGPSCRGATRRIAAVRSQAAASGDKRDEQERDQWYFPGPEFVHRLLLFHP